jgi:hypothetical protein
MFMLTIGLIGVQLGKLCTEYHDGIGVEHEWLSNVTVLCLGNN